MSERILSMRASNHNPPEANQSSFAPTTTCGEHPPGSNAAVRADPGPGRAAKRQRSGRSQASKSPPLPHRRRPRFCLLLEDKGVALFQRFGSERQDPRSSRNRCRMESTGGGFRPPKLHSEGPIWRVKCTREAAQDEQSAPGTCPVVGNSTPAGYFRAPAGGTPPWRVR
jgi:hypothetical protein